MAWPAAAEPIRRLGQNPRGLALGGTGMSYADDEMGLYYNPAGLASSNKIWVEVLPIALESSDDGITFIRDKAAAGDSNIAQASDVTDLIRDGIDKDFHYRVFTYPTAIVSFGRGLSFGAGAFVELEADLQFHNQATPELDAYYRNDQGLAAGLAFPIAQGRVLFGLSARNIKREVGEGTIGSAELAVAAANDNLDLAKELDLASGTGTGYDVGLIYRLETLSALRSQFALTVQNAGDTDLGAAGTIPQEVSIGYSSRPRFGPLVQTLLAFEYRDVTYDATADSSYDKRLHVGFELGVLPMDPVTSLATFRVGFGSGGPSYGVELAFWHFFSIQYVYYEQEYGDVSGEDRRKRHILQFNLIGF